MKKILKVKIYLTSNYLSSINQAIKTLLAQKNIINLENNNINDNDEILKTKTAAITTKMIIMIIKVPAFLNNKLELIVDPVDLYINCFITTTDIKRYYYFNDTRFTSLPPSFKAVATNLGYASNYNYLVVVIILKYLIILLVMPSPNSRKLH
ncbi:hypothetical protein P344_05285 [Spiroplasma mirum ATCC 29335]|uniref:Uncharacterized protein n=1 Tax=Spiroplasma mirum ATCC 29335 TaxID=838561 RepID=W0GQB4_9MOLU|nr:MULTISPECIES: hypothetical protein [Spiroplasma]AHF61278.1 hypothetical protein SMM_0888 [Spiroplasma mirum ATCC 29335]AHI58379.1 hypothetical protein P344_05285 [Spiroplasma mirum ATCC 29335]AKM53341.1 hypothetical protein SATRI_v1c09530 [Spiroplasma atrichopogonis]